MATILTILEIFIIAIALQDLFHTIFHPAVRGNISDWPAFTMRPWEELIPG